MASTSKLFEPLKLGRNELLNRLALAPLTRFRADDAHVPLQPIVSEHYAQRASSPGTLLITEATFIAPAAGGFARAPGIWSRAQIESWSRVTEAIHAKQGVVFMQLWALGRVAPLDGLQADPAIVAMGESETVKVVSAGDIPAEGAGCTKPTPLTEEEIAQYVAWYTTAARNAIEAGFDGVEIHGANGYLVDQFIQDVSNNRTDAWGGSIERRSRFALAVVQSVTEAIGGDRTAIRLSPYNDFQSMKMQNPGPQFQHLVRELKKFNLAYLHLIEPRVRGFELVDDVQGESLRDLVDIWGNQSPVLLAGGFTPATAVRSVEEEYPDKDVVVVFGRHFISNPDLVYRIQHGIEFTPYNRATFYDVGSAKGYNDYPFSKEFLAQEQGNGHASI